LASREIFREAVLLFTALLLEALSITDFTSFNLATNASEGCPLAAKRISLITFLTLVFTALLRSRLTSFCFARFNADL
jgi:hypothetical protein